MRNMNDFIWNEERPPSVTWTSVALGKELEEHVARYAFDYVNITAMSVEFEVNPIASDVEARLIP